MLLFGYYCIYENSDYYFSFIKNIIPFYFILHLQGTSTKYSPQRVGLNHVMDDEDVIQIVKK